MSVGQPLVSIVLIFLNEERFLQEAIDSVFAQSYDHWELLLVDDGSIDHSTTIARQYAQQYPEKVRYLEHDGHQNRGMPASRNLGMRHAHGVYISFLDADDVWLPRKLEQQVTILESTPDAALVCGRTEWWYSWSGDPADGERDFVQRLEVPLNALARPPALLMQILRNEWAVPHDILARRVAVEAVGGYEEHFRGPYQVYEDQSFQSKLFSRYTAFVADACWCRYRQHASACTAQSDVQGKKRAARNVFLSWLARDLARQRVPDRALWRALRLEQRQARFPLLYQVAGSLKSRRGQFVDGALWLGGKTLPAGLRRWLRVQWQTYRVWPPVGRVRFGSLRRLTPISRDFGFDRGAPVDRYYIEGFLARQADDVRGRVLELGDATYTRRFGGNRVTRSDVLHGRPGNPAATIVADLTDADQIPSDSFDCVILTQTLLLIYDVRAAIRTIHRILKPGGVALVTVPGITQIIRGDMEEYGQYWSFSSQSAQRLFEEVFPGNVRVEAYGNVLAAASFLYGLGINDLRPKELNYHDPDYELIIAVRAVKAE